MCRSKRQKALVTCLRASVCDWCYFRARLFQPMSMYCPSFQALGVREGMEKNVLWLETLPTVPDYNLGFSESLSPQQLHYSARLSVSPACQSLGITFLDRSQRGPLFQKGWVFQMTQCLGTLHWNFYSACTMMHRIESERSNPSLGISDWNLIWRRMFERFHRLHRQTRL